MTKGVARLPVYRDAPQPSAPYEQLHALLHELADARIAVLALERSVAEETRRVRGETLTRRQCEVLELRGAGKRNKEIGSALNISERTVKFHVQQIRAKFPELSMREIALRGA